MLTTNMKNRTKCLVPNCPNSGSKSPDKVLVNVNNHLKRKWCKQLNIEYNPQRRLYCCEDHLNLNEDLENYYQWKLMKSAPRLKSTATLKYSLENVPPSFVNMPTSSGVQVEKKNELSTTLRQLLLQSNENIPSETVKKDDSSSFNFSTCAGPVKIDVSTQCNNIKMIDKSTLVKKYDLITKPVFTMIDIESTPTASSNPSMYGSTIETDVSDSDFIRVKDISSRMHFVNLIYNNPKMYLGLPKEYLWLIKVIEKQMSVKEIDILLTLVKIKLNDSMMRLADEFMISRSSVTIIFYRGIFTLASYFLNFVFMPAPDLIKQNLPLVFKIRYSNVQCILDAFEIEIEKPENPQTQAQTWSQYKSCNTIKYLVGCTPNGFISFISKGYGGRISDKALVEKSNLLEMLPTNAVVMADRGFKEIETLLMTKNIKLLRPPSVYSSKTPTQEEVLQTKVIASLRVHIERVIRRIREFRLLKPHSVVSHKHVGYLDHIVLIACGLINLQSEIIKR